MIIRESFLIDAPLAAVSAYFQDIQRLQECVPGLEEIRKIESNRYQASLVVAVGPVSASFHGTLDLDTTGDPSHFSARGKGRDRSTGSMVDVTFTADLEEVEGSTKVAAAADVTIRGRLGQFGSGIIQATAKQLVREFAACTETSIGREASESSPPQRPNLIRIIVQSLLLWARTGVKGVARWLRSKATRS